MKDFYEFASEHYFLTFLLAVIIGETIIKTAHAIFNRNCKCNYVECNKPEETVDVSTPKE